MNEADIRSERLRKIEILKEAGLDPYPVSAGLDMTLQVFLTSFDELDQSGQAITIGGRVMAIRGQGGIMFADLFDGTARVQAVVQKTEMETLNDGFFELFAKTVDVGDFISVTGEAFETKRGEKSVQATKWQMLAKSLLPIPDAWFGLKDEELKLRERYLSILLDPELRALFERRERFWQTIREFYIERNFFEAETPILESTPGGADARPFETHHHALDIQVYLRISLELWLKRLLIAGFPKVFEIGRIFRNEGQSREHLQDYTQLESYEAFKDMRDGMKSVQELYRRIVINVYGRYSFSIGDHTVDFADNWEEIDFCLQIQKRFSVDPLSCTEDEAIQAVRNAQIEISEALNKTRAIDHLWKVIRKGISGPAFLVNVPVYLEPLAKRSTNNSGTVERFQVILAGSEMGKGFSELNDPQDQRARFEEQQKMRDAGDPEAQRLDEDYVRAMEYGMPPAFGFGMSERLFSFLENRPAHEAQLFPLLRPKDAQNKEGKATKTMTVAIVLNKGLLDAQWKELNTTAHLAASFASREGKKLLLQDSVASKDGVAIPLNIQHAIMIRSAKDVSDLRSLMSAADKEALTVIPFTKEMIETTDDRKVSKLTSQQDSAEIKYLGVLVFGDRKTVEALTSAYPLHE